MTNDERMNCNFCEGGKKVITLTESNKSFISKRISDGTIDEALTISRIAWDNFPILKESADTKKKSNHFSLEYNRLSTHKYSPRLTQVLVA